MDNLGLSYSRSGEFLCRTTGRYHVWEGSAKTHSWFCLRLSGVAFGGSVACGAFCAISASHSIASHGIPSHRPCDARIDHHSYLGRGVLWGGDYCRSSAPKERFLHSAAG